jgi:hypothetical protein
LGRAALALNARRPPITGGPGPFIKLRRVLINAQIGGPLSGQTRLRRAQGRVVRRPTSIQNNSGLLRPIQVCPKDLPIRSVAG